jgi:uroporphyrinogen decarboxylase
MDDVYIATAERYEHDAIFLHPNPDSVEATLRLIEIIHEQTAGRYFLMRHGDATDAILDGDRLRGFCFQLVNEPQRMVDAALEDAVQYQKHGGLDGFSLYSDYCFDSELFLSPRQFDEFIFPYLKELIQGYRELGFYTIKHTDGNIMPIIDRPVEANPPCVAFS